MASWAFRQEQSSGYGENSQLIEMFRVRKKQAEIAIVEKMWKNRFQGTAS
jgi:hypothetical protein